MYTTSDTIDFLGIINQDDVSIENVQHYHSASKMPQIGVHYKSIAITPLTKSIENFSVTL